MKDKVGLYGIFNEISTSKIHHGFGYIKTLITQIESILGKEVDVLNTDSDISEYKYLFIDEGVNFVNKSWNKIGGDFTKTLIKLEKFNNYTGKVFYNALKEVPDYEHMVTKRKLDAKYTPHEFVAINFIELTDKLTLGDSHSVSAHEQCFAMNTINGKTMNGFLTDGLKQYVPSNIKHLRFYAGNIDIRFHFHRLSVNLTEFVAELEKQLLDLNLDHVDIMQPLPIEDESRKLPGTGLYKGQSFYGSWEERNNIRNTFSDLLEDMCNRNNFTYMKWPDNFKDKDGKLKFEIMEPRQSVHIKPIYYYTEINKK